MNKVLVVE